jgi:multiple sugar transport system substrate-binding protein
LLAGAAFSTAVMGPLAACGGSKEAGEEAPKPGAATAPVTLEMAWENTTNDMGLFVTGQAKQMFEERHPGVTLNFTGMGNDQAKVLAQIAARTPPHVLHVNGNLVTSYVVKNTLLPLDPLIQKDKDVKPADFAPKMWDIFFIRGKQYALAREGGPNALYFNKSAVQGGGVQTPTDAWTLANEYREAAVKLTKPGDPMVFGTHVADWRIWVYSNGGDVVDAGLTKYVLDQPAAVDALQLYQDFRYKFKCATTPQDNAAQAAMQRFIAGGLALFPGLRSAGNTKGFASPNVGIAMHPQGKAGRKFAQAGNGLAIMQPSRALDACWEAVKWYVSPEFQKLHYKMGIGGVVARLSVLQSEEYLNSAIPREWNEFFAKGVAFLRGPSKLSNWPDVDAALNKEFAAFENGQDTAAALTARIAPIIGGLLKEGEKG